jgi:hypothetical protein
MAITNPENVNDYKYMLSRIKSYEDDMYGIGEQCALSRNQIQIKLDELKRNSNTPAQYISMIEAEIRYLKKSYDDRLRTGSYFGGVANNIAMEMPQILRDKINLSTTPPHLVEKMLRLQKNMEKAYTTGMLKTMLDTQSNLTPAPVKFNRNKKLLLLKSNII